MNTLRQYKLFLWLPAMIAVAGCKKLIEINPQVSTIGTEQVFQTNEQGYAALAGIYSGMMTNNGNMLFSNGGLTVYAGMSADELVNLSGSNNETDYQFVSNKLDFTSDAPYSIIWKPAYTFIYRANAIIEGVAASTSLRLDKDARNILTGESLFVRAFCYFYLTNFFGDVPLALSTDFNETSTMRRTPQADVYAQIVKDLQEAQTKLPDDYSTGGGERVRPNKWAATALLARVQLYRENWEDAEVQASAVIGASHYGLPSELGSVFLTNSREAIWQLKQSPSLMPMNATWDGLNCLPSFRMLDYSPIEQEVFLMPEVFEAYLALLVPGYYFTPQMAQVFEPGDKRKEIWVDTMRTPASAPYNGVPIYYPRKYTIRKNSASEPITQYFMVLRLAEQYLVRAEARARLDDLAGATADLDTVRHRAGLPGIAVSGKEAILEAVAHERQAELFAEWGHRWLDLKRTGKANGVLGAIPAKQPWKPFQLLYPIPPAEISANPNIKQNPDY